MNTGKAWWTLIVLIILASIAKIVPVTLVSKFCSKKPWFYCLSIGVLMNTRGIVQLVVLNIGVELGVISPMIFAIFVLMATILTLFTSPILSLLYRRDYDIRKLSIPNVAADLRDVREGEIDTTEEDDNKGNIETISNGDIHHNQSKRSSIKSSRRSITSISGRKATVTFDHQVNYAEINLNGTEQESSTIENTGTMTMSSPRRSICMTRF